MTRTAYQTLLERLPAEHHGLVEDIVRALKLALRRERSTRKVFEKHLRRSLTIRQFGELQRIAQVKISSGGTPTERSLATTGSERDAAS